MLSNILIFYEKLFEISNLCGWEINWNFHKQNIKNFTPLNFLQAETIEL